MSFALVVLLLAAVLAMGSATREAYAAEFKVIGTGDAAGTCPTASTCASLRQAINSANGSAGADTIVFDIAGAGPHTITIATALPTITQQLTINGFCATCDGATANSAALFQPINAVYKVIIDGPGTGFIDGFVITSSGAVTIRGLNIRDFNGSAVNITSGTGHVIAGNFIGTNETGTVASGANTGNNVAISGAVLNPTIGGANPADRNLISGKSGAGGVGVNAGLISATVQGLKVQGNYIGTNAAGTAAIGNQTGVTLSDATNSVGGSVSGQGNLISGNQIGVSSGAATNVSISGNRIGTNAAGTAAISNGTGIMTEMTGSAIGAAVAGGGNLISGNGNGITLSNAADNIDVVNNTFGLGADGSTLIPNTTASLRIDGASNIDVGLVGANGGNRFAGDSSLVVANQHGIQITSTWNDIRITNNTMGVSLTGPAGQRGNAITASGTGTNLSLAANSITFARTTAVNLLMDSLTGFSMRGNSIGVTVGGGPGGNLATGVLVNNTTGVIGGPDPGDSNIIAFNGGDGIALTGSSNVTITRNSIYQNGGTSQAIGIDLGNDGQPSNDQLDPDTGPNGLLNRPENQSFAYVDGASATQTMLIRSLPNTLFTVELFRNTTCFSQGAQGEIFVGSFVAQVTDGSGFRSFTAEWPGALPGEFLSATITDPDGNTSEFNSVCSPVLRPAADVDCNNAVTSVDVLAALNWLAGITTGPQADTCAANPLSSPIDVDQSQTEELYDAIYIAQTVAGLRELDGDLVN